MSIPIVLCKFRLTDRLNSSYDRLKDAASSAAARREEILTEGKGWPPHYLVCTKQVGKGTEMTYYIEVRKHE